MLAALAKAAGYADLREIASKSWAEVIAQLEQKKDQNLRARGLELLTIKICQTLDLDFMGWRETDEDITGGGEVDAMLHSSRLIYSRWQVQCKNTPSQSIGLEDVAKEVGLLQAWVVAIRFVGFAVPLD